VGGGSQSLVVVVVVVVVVVRCSVYRSSVASTWNVVPMTS
jgi:hypothetical protein